ncbi:MAG: hypothetical protein ABSH51_29065 [Solirubrobacteraceae bacterium]
MTVGNAPTIGADERAGSGELIDPVVAVLGDVDVARGIDGDGGGLDERPGADPLDPGLAGGGAGLKLVLTVGNAPAVGADERAGGGELIDPVVVEIGDVNVARAIGGDAPGCAVELPGAAAVEPCLAGAGAGLKPARAVADTPSVGLDERAGGGELINPAVIGIGDVDVARGIDGDAPGLVELPRS